MHRQLLTPSHLDAEAFTGREEGGKKVVIKSFIVMNNLSAPWLSCLRAAFRGKERRGERRLPASHQIHLRTHQRLFRQ